MNARIERGPDTRQRQVHRWTEPVHTGSIVVCGTDELVAMCRNGQLLGTLPEGEHVLDPAEVPFVEDAVGSGDGDVVDAEVWFVSLDPHVCTAAGQIENVREGERGVTVTATFEAEMAIRIGDPTTVLGLHAGDLSSIPEVLPAQLSRLLRKTLEDCFTTDRLSFYELEDEFFDEGARVQVLPAIRQELERHGFSAEDLRLQVEPNVESKRRLQKASEPAPPPDDTDVEASIPPPPDPVSTPDALGEAEDEDSIDFMDAGTALDLGVGARVRAQAGGGEWFVGVVVVYEHDRCLVRWDEAPATWVPAADLAVDQPGSGIAPPEVDEPEHAPGDRVLGSYGDATHPGRVVRATSGWYEIEWENGNTAWLPSSAVGPDDG